MHLASPHAVVLGSISFAVFWILAVFPDFKLLPIGRTAGALAGAVLMVVFNVESPEKAYEAVDLKIITLLFATMVISVYLEKADMFRYLGGFLSWKSMGSKDLLCRVCILSAVCSALFTNDTCCFVLTQFVLKLCKEKNLPPKPFLLALATSANVGSVATPIGNPQNLVIAVQSGISFGRFVLGLLGAMALGVCLNMALLLSTYYKQLTSLEVSPYLDMSSSSSNGKEHQSATPWTPFQSGNLYVPQEIFDEQLSNEAKSLQHAGNDISVQDYAGMAQVDECDHETVLQILPPYQKPLLSAFNSWTKKRTFGQACVNNWRRWQKGIWKLSVYSVTALMLAAFLCGLDMAWTALTAAVVLMALDFCDAGILLEKVSYPLLVFFMGMFISVDGFNKTGIPEEFWNVVEPYADTTTIIGQTILTLVVIVLSNVASNVPTVLLLGPKIASSTFERDRKSVPKAWLLLAWASTIGGNLTLVGSAANLIVSEQAAKNEILSYDLTFFAHVLYGFPSTLIIAICGVFLVHG